MLLETYEMPKIANGEELEAVNETNNWRQKRCFHESLA